jgi:hypothetical protein
MFQYLGRVNTSCSSAVTDESPKVNNEATVMIDQDALAIAIARAKKNPRVPLWSEMTKTLLLYNKLIREKKLARPKMSLREEGSNILDEAVRHIFPEMCKLIEKKLNKGRN